MASSTARQDPGDRAAAAAASPPSSVPRVPAVALAGRRNAGMPPIGWAIYALALVSILYEPVRGALYPLGQAVGGVGGVGGLTNQVA